MLMRGVFLSLIIAVATAQQLSAQTLVHLWSFDEAITDFQETFADSSGNGHTGTGAAAIREGLYGNAAYFYAGGDFAGDGIDFYDDNPETSVLPTGADDNWSMNVWVKVDESIPTLNYLAGFGIRGAPSGTEGTDFASRAIVNISEGYRLWGSHIDARSNTAFAADSEWHMYTATYDDVSTAIKVYVDGSHRGEFLLSSDEAKDWVDASAEVHVGNPAPAWNGGTGINEGGTDTFEGYLDEFAIWDGALTDDQITALYRFNDIDIAFARADLDRSGVIDSADWDIFAANGYADLTALTALEAALAGDLDGDFDNDRDDFNLFKSDYIAANGLDAFEALGAVAVPEPSSVLLLGLAGLAFAAIRKR
ncbi:LamG-like jellyroll fold domain-containing protein [Aeoliella mucimassa]|uniref:LamG-like jellyroll fold domain-containing protein n=1 Tax=Aeoliella mucimassa TaxID=2527972 RepID=A0A518AVT4_9BACT|nr:LamG-like jellyroll fold domain-containing protein [Aeoliella mucimassa]QDU58812.1 hypothetical protein Pan181_50520 [Aeoliella mucimassa]